jgi:CheY-like chemotaxis protein
LQGCELLLVEYSAFNQQIATEILKINGINTIVVNNGQEALDRLKEQTFDGVLIDCQMPVMDGFEATKKLREQKQFIAMRANVMQSDIDAVVAVMLSQKFNSRGCS